MLCVLLPSATLPAQPARPAPALAGQIQGEARVLHALNRFTFGPRPGEVASVQAMGLDKWFAQQLNPNSIPDTAFQTRLDDFPAMQMSLAELTHRYPGPQILKQMESGAIPLPSDPTQRAIATDEIAFYKIQKAKQAAKPSAAPAADGATMTTMSADADPAVKPRRRKQQGGQAANAMIDPDGPDRAEAKPIPVADLAPDPLIADAAAEPSQRMTREELAAILAQPPAQRYQAILGMQAQDLIRLRQTLRPADAAQLTAGFTPIQKETLAALPGGLRMIASEAMQTRLLRDVYSDRQLQAVMTDFWINHFNVYARKNQIEPYLLPAFERETVLPNALGNFEDLLVAVAKSPAMLVYLDNFRSTGPDSPQAARLKQVKDRNPNAPILKAASAGLNENYGRELMELHTLGVGGGYTQADVTEVAEVFTGWTLDKPYQGGGFEFDPRKHEPGAKTVLGQTIAGSGVDEGLQVLHMLASSQATAHFISQKLAIRFVSDTPPPALVDRMAKSFLESHGDIKTVLRTMFASPEFWAPDAVNAKVKTPLEFVASAARASNLQIANAVPLVQALDKLGMPFYGHQAPDGYSWLKDEWVSTGALVTRLNFSLVLAGDRLPGSRTDWTQLLAGPTPGVRNAAYDPVTAEAEKERKLEALLWNGSVSDRTRQTVLAQARDTTVSDQAATQFDLGGQPGAKKANGGSRALDRNQAQLAAQAGPNDPQAAVMAGLLLGSPEFQRR